MNMPRFMMISVTMVIAFMVTGTMILPGVYGDLFDGDIFKKRNALYTTVSAEAEEAHAQKQQLSGAQLLSLSEETTTEATAAAASAAGSTAVNSTASVDKVLSDVDEALGRVNMNRTVAMDAAIGPVAEDFNATGSVRLPKKYGKNIADQLDKVLDEEFGENGEEDLENEANEGRETFRTSVEHGEKVGVVVRVGTGEGAKTANLTNISSYNLMELLKNINAEKIVQTLSQSEEIAEGQGGARLLDENNVEYVVSRPRSRSFELQHDIALVRDITTVLMSSSLCGLIAYLLSQPPISGFLIGGSIVGPGGLGMVNELVQVETVAQLGVIFLLMGLGMEFKLQKLKGVRTVALLGGALQICASIAVCGLGALLFKGRWKKGLFVGAFLSMSSTTVVLQSITERGQLQSTFGSITIGTLILQDVAVGLLFALLPVLGKHGGSLSDALGIALHIFSMLLIFSAGCWLVSKTFLNRLLGILAGPGPMSLGLTHAFMAVMGLIVSVISDKMGLSLELGAFAAGVMVTSTEHSTQMLHVMEPIRHVFVALFLGTVGMLVSMKFLMQHIGLLLMSVIVVSLLKTLIIAGIVKAFGYPLRTSVGVGAALAQIGEFSFVLLGRARELDIIEGSFYLLLLGSAALSLFSTPIAFKYAVWPIVGHQGPIIGGTTLVSGSNEKASSGSSSSIPGSPTSWTSLFRGSLRGRTSSSASNLELIGSPMDDRHDDQHRV